MDTLHRHEVGGHGFRARNRPGCRAEGRLTWGNSPHRGREGSFVRRAGPFRSATAPMAACRQALHGRTQISQSGDGSAARPAARGLIAEPGKPQMKSVFRGCDVGALKRNPWPSGCLCRWRAACAVRFLFTPTSRDGLRPVVLGCRMSSISSNAGSKRPWGWPYSGPKAAGISEVDAGESVGPCRRSCRVRQQVRGSRVLAPEGRSGTLTTEEVSGSSPNSPPAPMRQPAQASHR
jgi:hypothetical protein